MNANSRADQAAAFRSAISGLPKRVQILGAYVSQLYEDGQVSRDAPVSELVRIAIRQLGVDMKGLAGFVVEQQVRGFGNEVKRMFDQALDGFFKRPK